MFTTTRIRVQREPGGASPGLKCSELIVMSGGLGGSRIEEAKIAFTLDRASGCHCSGPASLKDLAVEANSFGVWDKKSSSSRPSERTS